LSNHLVPGDSRFIREWSAIWIGKVKNTIRGGDIPTYLKDLSFPEGIGGTTPADQDFNNFSRGLAVIRVFHEDNHDILCRYLFIIITVDKWSESFTLTLIEGIILESQVIPSYIVILPEEIVILGVVDINILTRLPSRGRL
jgi:hypothetical protein